MKEKVHFPPDLQKQWMKSEIERWKIMKWKFMFPLLFKDTSFNMRVFKTDHWWLDFLFHLACTFTLYDYIKHIFIVCFHVKSLYANLISKTFFHPASFFFHICCYSFFTNILYTYFMLLYRKFKRLFQPFLLFFLFIWKEKEKKKFSRFLKTKSDWFNQQQRRFRKKIKYFQLSSSL